jgi:hypothetical protein
MPGDGQLIGSTDAEHIDPYEFRSDDHRMPAISGDRIERLEPGQGPAFLVEIGTIASHIGHGPARFRTMQDVAFSQMLTFD